MFSLQSF